MIIIMIALVVFCFALYKIGESVKDSGCAIGLSIMAFVAFIVLVASMGG